MGTLVFACIPAKKTLEMLLPDLQLFNKDESSEVANEEFYKVRCVPSFSGKKTSRGPVAQCPLNLGWTPKTKCLGTQLALGKG